LVFRDPCSVIRGRGQTPRGVSEVWQGKGLRGCGLGSVANKRVAGKIVEVWQGKDLAAQARRRVVCDFMFSIEGGRIPTPG